MTENFENTAKENTLSEKDIPFLPGYVFQDPTKANFKKAHAFDKTNASIKIDDQKALCNPLGYTATGLCHKADLTVDQATLKAEFEKTERIVPEAINSTTRGVIGCRRGLVTDIPEEMRQKTQRLDATSPYATAVTRDHDLAMRQAKQVEEYEPAYVKLDQVVLRFYAWTAQEVQESQEERYRVRHVMIDYAVVDGTVIIEERVELNAGHPQGVILRRQRVPVDYRNQESGFIGVDDLEIGTCVNIYGTVYNIYAISDEARVFLNAEGIEVPANITDVPKDQYLTERQSRHIAETQKSIITPHIAEDKLAKYLRHDREVLSFMAYWNNHNKTFQETRHFVIEYFLADDCIQILENLPANCGRDPWPVFLRKEKVPTQHTITMFKEHEEQTHTFIRAQDFYIGKTINIFGRDFYIYDTDDFTDSYMINELGRTAEEMKPILEHECGCVHEDVHDINELINIKDMNAIMRSTRMKASAAFPDDVLGIGDDADTIGSCVSVHPIPPHKDILRWMKFGNLQLEFVAKMVPYQGKPVHITNVDRRFVINYYFSDDTFSIVEVQGVTATGFGNRFLQRMRLVNNEEMNNEEFDRLGRGHQKKYYTWTDCEIGHTITANAHSFEIVDVDQRTKKILAGISYFNNNLEDFPAELFVGTKELDLEAIEKMIAEHKAKKAQEKE